MARRLMSRRGGSASQPQVTPYQQIELEDGWREWENTKQELVLIKRQLTEKDALIVQLKTASRRLQETLRKKDKDLQAAFAILRSPQDAKTTKTRKQELIDRLVSECMQRAATSEALAEERRRELDRIKYSSKFLRFQELEVEIEECHTEIERLRAKLETTSAPSPTVIAGKLKLSSAPLSANGSGSFTGTLTKKTKLDPLNFIGDKGPESRQTASVPINSSAIKMYTSQSAAGQVRVVPPAKYDHREGFVSKTRRRALEAEYYKQVRLAQLEVECELEENLHIRAAREAKRLEAIEHQVRQTELFVKSARYQQEDLSTLGNNESTKLSSTEEGKPSNDHDSVEVDANPIKPVLEQITPQQTDEPEGNSVATTEEEIVINSQHVDMTVDGTGKETAPEEPKLKTAPIVNFDGEEHRDSGGEALSKQKTYEDDEFDGSDDDTTDNSKEIGLGGVEHGVWNADPNPQNNHKPDKLESNCSELDQPVGITNNDDGSTKSVAWNVDPNPATSIETDLQSENHTDRVVWNADPHVVDLDVSMDDASVVDEDDAHDAVLQKEDLVPSEGNVWNLDPTPSVLTDREQLHAEAAVVDSDDEVDVHDAVLRKENSVSHNVWNLDPPSSAIDSDNEDVDAVLQKEYSVPSESNVWNLDPTPSVLADGKHALAEASDVQNAVQEADSNDKARKIWNLDPMPSSDPTHTTTSITEVDNGENAIENEHSVWNLEPVPVVEAVPSPKLPLTHSSNEEFPAEVVANSSEDIVDTAPSSRVDPPEDHNPPDATLVSDSTTITESSESPWNLDPNPSPSPPVGNDDVRGHDVIGAGELIVGAENAEVEPNHDPTKSEAGTNSVWNLDPTVPTIDPERDRAGSSAPGEGGDEHSVWNLDPHTGDASEPSDTVTTPHEDIGAATLRELKDKHRGGTSEEGYTVEKDPQLDPGEAPTFENAGSDGDMAEGPEPVEHTSNQSSPREYEDNVDDATPEYTPPSTARDSDAAGYDDDPTW